MPLMVGREKRSKMMLARVVPFKGGGVDWLVGQLIRDLRKILVHGKVILKSGPRERHLGCFQRCPLTDKERERVQREHLSPMYCRTSRAKS